MLGYAYIGVVQVLEERGILKHCKRFGGASAGAMAAGLLACGASSAILAQALGSLDATTMQDSSANLLVNVYDLWHDGGWAKGEALEKWYGDLLAQLCGGADQRNITLSQVYARFGNTVVLSQTCLESGTTHYYCKDTKPDLPLARAVRMSAGYPILYPMVIYEGNHWWDGGIGDNYPIHVFDSDDLLLVGKHDKTRVANAATVGFKLVSSLDQPLGQRHRQSTPIHNVYDAIKSVGNMVLAMSRQLHVHARDWERSVLIDVGQLSAIDFNLNQSEKDALISNGRSATEAFLAARK